MKKHWERFIALRVMLITVDTNVLMDLAAEVESIIDALEVVRRRLKGARLLIVPAVI